MGAMMAWLTSMAPAGLSLGRTVFNLLSRGWTVNEIPSTPWASRSRQIKVLRSRSTRITAGRGTYSSSSSRDGHRAAQHPSTTRRCAKLP